MKKLILLITIAASMTLWFSCQKEALQQTKSSTIINPQEQQVGEVPFGLYSGTRKNLESDIATMRLMGATDTEVNAFIDEAGPCTGKSICIVFGEAGTIINGGLHQYDQTNPYDNSNRYSMHIKNNNGQFKFIVKPGDISTSLYPYIFAGNQFEMDSNFSFPSWACNMIGVPSLTIPAGIYAVQIDQQGNTFFNF